MNRLFYPGGKRQKWSLTKNRKMVRYDNSSEAKDIRGSIPANWYYNEEEAQKVWDDLEKEAEQKAKEMPKEENPFEKIDESAHRIRNMIDNYEVSDQDFLLALMDMLEDDDQGLSDQADILIEARFRLARLVEDHAGNQETQSQLLDSLQYWFQGLEENGKHSVTMEAGELRENELTYDESKLQDMVKKSFEVREVTTDQIEAIHRSIIDGMSKKMRDMQRKIEQQETEIDQLQKTIEDQSSKRKRQRNFVNNSC